MIRVVLSGGLGNQLFQYALGRHLSIKANENLVLDASLYGRAYKSMLASLLQFDLHAAIPAPPLSMYVRKILRTLVSGNWGSSRRFETAMSVDPLG